ncbi:MAG TPA: diguanylate cyclase [Steroidobacteraceae bacterium]|nr:diguanylate cyclase [Steroidobacteraceae bacterium]
MRGWIAVWLMGWAASFFPGLGAAAASVGGNPASAVPPAFEITMLDASAPDAEADTVTHGSLDSRFKPYNFRQARRQGGAFWLKLQATEDFTPAAVPALIAEKGRHLLLDVFADRGGQSEPLRQAAELPQFLAAHEVVFVLPHGLKAGESLYVHVKPEGRGSEMLSFSTAPLDQVLARGADHARTIALAFGALMAMALSALLIWFVLSDMLFILYAALISLQAVYVAYFSGQGFDWPVLSYALPLTHYAWNVPIALSGAASCLFVREIADLRHFSPRVHRVFGWFAVAFVLSAFSNLADVVGLGTLVVAMGNLLFLSSAVFTLVVAFMAWRRGNRAAGWFLIAWGLLEAVTIATAVRLLIADANDSDRLLFYVLPASMVAAAVLIALGVADRLRQQRVALTDAERRAQTDPLTGVLNRRSLVERLDAACLRARARGLPIALLFIDLDHFKQINDSYGHPAGDACLSAIIDPIQAELRQSDVIGRYGGEEFVVVLSSAGVTAAHAIAQRILERVADVRVEGFGGPIRLTCSIGVAASDTLGVWGQHLIARADAAVYDAKRAGRNRVQVAEPLAA